MPEGSRSAESAIWERDPEIRVILNEIEAALRGLLGPRFVGLYLYGSVVAGGFDRRVSDLDLLAVSEGDLTAGDLEAVRAMHAEIAAAHPNWDDRIEVAYLSREALAHFRERDHLMGIISPGEPFHQITSGIDWLMNWYFVQEYGVTLAGPPPSAVIPPISRAEFLEASRVQALDWARGRYPIDEDNRGLHGYAVLSACRALMSHRLGTMPSKPEAAEWAKGELPDWSDLIDRALVWRNTTGDDHLAARPRIAAFLRLVGEILERESRRAPDQA